MLAFPHSVRIFVAVEPVDMRKQYDGLWAAVQTQLGEDPKSGALFCFTNRERTRLKLLYWDGTGVWVLAKRLEQRRFSWPKPSERKCKLALTPEALALLIGGVELQRCALIRASMSASARSEPSRWTWCRRSSSNARSCDRSTGTAWTATARRCSRPRRSAWSPAASPPRG